MSPALTLDHLGWRTHFASQLDMDSRAPRARVVNVHRAHIEVLGENGAATIELAGSDTGRSLTVGDWVLLDDDYKRVEKRLEPFGVFQRWLPSVGLETSRWVKCTRRCNRASARRRVASERRAVY